eukprot:TRINITY_DN3355_c3_g1_i1.p1 TRINITY_DN3355_c3_g1~~TRINITY_DN3355_c3_g1_i1.p1  ORF type:complete len:326 (-),score=89.41 TRINITY_DN3355_c3_g1_i1:136-1113(-)
MSSNNSTLNFDEIRFKMPEGIKIAAKAYGNDDDPDLNIIAIHGFLDTAKSFDTLIPLIFEKLEQKNKTARIIAVDLSGHGKSDHRSSYGISWIIEIFTIADSLGWNKFGIIAHSMGTGIAINVAAVGDDRVEFLVLLDSIGARSITPKQAPLLFKKALKNRLYSLNRTPKIYKTKEEIISRMLNHESNLTESAARLLVDRSTEKIHTGGYSFSHDPKLKAIPFSLSTDAVFDEFIKRISCPVLVIWASHRWYKLDMKQIEHRQNLFKNIVVKQVEGSHHVHLLNPERVDSIIVDFWESNNLLTDKEEEEDEDQEKNNENKIMSKL